MDIIEVRNLLSLFEKGYSDRDVNVLDGFVDRVFIENNPIYFGTASKEECIGVENVKRLVYSDWKYWGELKIDVDNAIINLKDDIAYFITKGAIDWYIPEEGFLQKSIEDIRSLVNNENTSKEKLLAICNSATKMLYEAERGATHLLPVRLSGIAFIDDGQCKFAQLHLSHPTEVYPDSRIFIN